MELVSVVKQQKELIKAIAKFYCMLSIVSVLFYNSLWAVLFGSVFLYWFLRDEKKRWKRKRQQQLQLEFKEMMVSMITALQAGYALENVFPVIKEDLDGLFRKKSYLAKECDVIMHKLSMKRTIEEALRELADASELEELMQFVQVITIAKRNGGNLVKIARDSVNQITDAMEVKQEIMTMVASKKLEQKIMALMPFAIVCYLRLSNPGYLDALYGNVLGILIMSVCLAVIVAGNEIAKKILDISV